MVDALKKDGLVNLIKEVHIEMDTSYKAQDS